MRGKESLLVGTAARNINSEDHHTCFGSECLCIHVLGQSAYVYKIGLDCLCELRPEGLEL
jgi:hypothetical protein